MPDSLHLEADLPHEGHALVHHAGLASISI